MTYAGSIRNFVLLCKSGSLRRTCCGRMEKLFVSAHRRRGGAVALRKMIQDIAGTKDSSKRYLVYVLLSAAAPFFIEKAVQPQSVKVYGFPIRYPPFAPVLIFPKAFGWNWSIPRASSRLFF